MIRKLDIVFLILLVVLAGLSTLINLGKKPTVKEEAVLVEPEKAPVPVKEEKPVVRTDVPDFAAMMDVKQKKSAFFGFIKELVDVENARLASLREKVQSFQTSEALSQEEQQWLLELADQYKVDDKLSIGDQFYDVLLSRVDELPVSLAMVQAANESAWGTSRFALEANNYFGQWCFSSGCGLVPARRPEGATYEVRKFESPAHSVRSYMHNLNSSHHYEAMREMRAKRRYEGEAVTGPLLAQGLYSYSIRGAEYVDELVRMIASNDLLRYDLETDTE